jgi:hypothetical protein
MSISTPTRQLRDTLLDDGLDSVLFDDSFKRSSLYFVLLETLRVSRGWVDDMIHDWDSLYRQWTREVRPSEIFDEADLQAVELAWSTVLAMVHTKGEQLKDIINRRSDEIKSVRDGVCEHPCLTSALSRYLINAGN